MPPLWATIGTHVELWHGCLDEDAKNIAANGVDLAHSRNDIDFGRGFYTTTSRDQAADRANRKYANLLLRQRALLRPAVLRFQIPLDELAKLESLMFVRGDFRHNSFWSLVHHCRSSTATSTRTHLHPGRAAPGDWYDLVCGPLARVWPPRGRIVLPGSDQFSFHTAPAIAILNAVIAVGAPEFEITILQSV